MTLQSHPPLALAGTHLARVSFDLPAPSGPIEAPLAAALAILLFRYNGQAAVDLNASRVTGSGETLWRGMLRLETAMEVPCRDIVEQAAGFLRCPDAATSIAGARSDASRAAISFVQPASPEGLNAIESMQHSAPEGGDEELHLQVAAARQAVRASFLYNTSVYNRARIERAAEHLKRLLSQVLADPDAPIARLALLSADERQLIACVCDGRPRVSRPELVHQAFEAQAAAAPGAEAVRFGDVSLSYGELNCRANALARRLAADGVGTESRVAVCLNPSLDLPVALLATLKAGAAYVPLDPTHPEVRLRALMEDVRPRVLITHACFLDKLAAAGTPALVMDEFLTLTRGFSGENLDAPVRPEQTASIYFTSGTTGAPKGAVASHANLASYIAAARERYGIGRADVMPAIARFSFSISMFELLSPLTAGGTLLILDREHILDMDRMSRTLEEVTIFHAGPSLLKNLVAHIKRRYADFEAFSRVRHASSGGDMIPPELLESLKEIFIRAEVFVIYGCTEISCMGCTYPVPRDRLVQRTYVGRPFDGMSVRVLDPAMNVLPQGLVGEIWFAGDGVVNGYLHRPDLTSQRFVEIDGRRFYRTGDVGRLSEDGWIELLGRSDFQLKLRGIRVEIGEVEHCLRRAAGVRDAVVMPMTLGAEKALVAYVVLDHDRPLDPGVSPIDAIHRHMVRHLPEYMLPATYVELDSLPLNHNMKVDRNALPAPEKTHRSAPERRLRPPRSDTEKRLAALWTKVLGVEGVGLDDRYFDMGGDSLRGLEFITEVGRGLGVDLKGLELVRESLEGLAAICDARLGRAPAFEEVAEEAGVAAAETAFEAFHFGQGGKLYGVLSGAPRANAQDAVLICSPLGQDGLRAHFILQRLAARLAAQGIPSLRFDYYACGDSMGDSVAAGCDRWRRDIRDAYCELKRRANAARITAVGVRLGATLLAEALQGMDVAALVVWDPVCDGARYYAETAAAHVRFVGRWRRLFRAPAPLAGAVEIIGWTCSEATVRELQTLVFPPVRSEPLPPLRWLATRLRRDLASRLRCDAASASPAAGQVSEASEQRQLFETASRGREGSRLETVEWDQGWNDISRMDEMLPDVGVSAALAKLAMERP